MSIACNIFKHKDAASNAKAYLFEKGIVTTNNIILKPNAFDNYHKKLIASSKVSYNIETDGFFNIKTIRNNKGVLEYSYLPNEAAFNAIDEERKRLGIYESKLPYSSFIALERERLDKEGNQKFNEEGDIYYQENIKEETTINQELNTKIKNFLTKLGITTINVDNIKDSEGNVLSAIAVVDMLNKVIKVVEGKANITTLPEEAAHIFVEMLQNTSMLQNMMNKITSYQVYKDVIDSDFYQKQYKGDELKLRKEAIGKLISLHIIGQVPLKLESQRNFITKWWNTVWSKVKSIFGKVDINEFKQAADSILNGNIYDLKYIAKDEIYYQNDDKQKNIIDALDNKYKISYNDSVINEKTGKKGIYELATQEGLKKILNRVSDRITKYGEKKGFGERTIKQKAEDEVRKKIGVAGHADINNIIIRIIEETNGNSITKKHTQLGDTVYAKLEEYMRDFIKSFPPGTKFYTEKTIYDATADEAGTIDLLAITPEGKVDIYDWKFIEFKNKDASGKITSESVPFYKEDIYNIQLSRYRNILKANYNVDVKSLGKARIIPISAVYKNNILQSIDIGNDKLNGLDKPYLNPIPITGKVGGEVEFTGNTKIDSLIEVLLQQRKRITDKVETTPESKLKKVERLERIAKSIYSLQVEQDVKSFLEDAIFELNYITNVGLENLNNDDIIKSYELINYYSDLLKNDILPEEQELKYKKEVSKVVDNAGYLYSKVHKEFETRIKATAESTGVNNIEELQPETGIIAGMFRTISQSNHPIIKTFYNLVMRQKAKVYDDTKILNNKINYVLKNLKAWGESNNLSGTSIFTPLLQIENGKWTGNLISVWNKQYFINRDNAIANKNTEWLKENSVFNEEEFKKQLEKNTSIWKKMYTNDIDSQKKLESRIEKYIKEYHPDYAGYYNKKNFFIRPIETWKSLEWTMLQKPENKALKEFYDLFTGTIGEFRDFLPLDINGNFIPNIKTDLMDQIAKNGLATVQGLGNSIVQHLEAGSDETVGMIDEVTGERIKQIPLLYTNKIDSTTKSQDLGKVLSIFADMAYNYKYMAEIESTSLMLNEVLASKKQIITNANGKTLKSKVTGDVAKVMGSTETLDKFNDYLNYYLYGIKIKGKDATFTFMGKELSSQKLFSKAMSYFSAKSLAGNLLSGLANGIGGMSNAFMEGTKGTHYTNKDFRRSIGWMASKDKKAYASINYWDIDSSETSFKKANNLSVSSITKNLTLDKLYFLQRGTDWPVENGTLLAMLQSHTLKDGKIIKKNKEDKSLIELTTIVNDKVTIDGLSEEEYHKFRRKVKYLYGTMKGNTNSDDINTIRLTILGQAGMQFRNWIPRMADERFGTIRYTGDLEAWEMGKYRNLWGQVVNKQIIPNIFNTLIQGGVLGFGSGIESKSITNKAIELYNKEKAKNPDLKITQEQFIKLHKDNLKSVALELQLILVLIGLLAALKPDDDDEKTPLRMAFYKIINRNLDEVSFFLNPSSTQSILKKPLPILGFADNVYNLIGDFTGEVTGQIIGNEEMVKKYKPMRSFNKTFPVLNSLESFWALTDPDYNSSAERSKKN